MKCVFLSADGKCFAELIRRGSGGEIPWEVDEETKTGRCMTSNFDQCPRFKAKMSVLTRGK